MENRTHALAAGLFTLLLGLASAWSIWWFSGKHQTQKEYTIVARENVTGLSLQGQVRYRGIRVGKVQSIGLDPGDVRNILIHIGIDSSVPVTRSTTAKLGYQGVTGIAHILLEETGEDMAPLLAPAGQSPRIALQQSLIQEMSEAGGETLRQARDLLTSANDLVDGDNRARIEQTLANLAATSANAKDASSHLRTLLAAENVRALQTTLARAEQAAAEAAPALSEARRVLEQMRAVSEKLDRLLADPSASGVHALLPRLNELGSELTANSRQLGRLLQALEEAPQSVVFGRPAPPPGPGEAGFAPPPAAGDRP